MEDAIKGHDNKLIKLLEICREKIYTQLRKYEIEIARNQFYRV